MNWYTDRFCTDKPAPKATDADRRNNEINEAEKSVSESKPDDLEG